ncbi:tetratricopeptide repeat protein [Streptomyces sp. NPDC051109]|uniref:tetratricopeptide repeat protein n=1 Tax=Streptomyces sp. NPDC051109 TaxID=3365642 RepID=UPI0037954E43
MEEERLVAVTGPGGPGSGYVIGPRLVLTSAHVVAPEHPDPARAMPLRVFRPGRAPVYEGRVVWCGRPGGRDDAALVRVDDRTWVPVHGPSVRWGRFVTDLPGQRAVTSGVPDVAQRDGQPVDTRQLSGDVNPGSGRVTNRYVLDLGQHPPAWPGSTGRRTSPWGGMSGAPMFCGRLLTGVIAEDPAHSGHGALVAVPSYVLHGDPGFRAACAEHGAGEAGLEPVEFQHLAEIDAVPVAEASGSPAFVLRAERRAVPFHGRATCLDLLTDWCGQDGFGAFLLHGPAGQGKTRLGHQLTARMAGEKWAVLWPRARGAADGLAVVRDAVKPLLIVLDYAEARADQLAALLEAAAEHGGRTRVKVLLLARTAGDWWAGVRTEHHLAEALLANAQVHGLAALEPDPAGRHDAYVAARAALASALTGLPGYAGHDWAGVHARLPVPALEREGFGNALTLHMTALADLLDAALPPWPAEASPPAAPAATADRPRPEEEVEDRLLTHERRYWERTAGAAPHFKGHLSPAALRDALTAAQMAGAADEDQADGVLCRVPSLQGQLRDRRNSVRVWIGSLYPPTDDGPWGSLQPDRLRERLAGRQLETDPRLVGHIVSGSTGAQAVELLTLCTRAAAHPVFRGRLDRPVSDLCVRHPAELALPAIDLATQADAPQPLLDALQRLIGDPAVPLDELHRLAGRLPKTTHRLAPWAADLATVLVERYRHQTTHDSTRLPNLARCLSNLAGRLADVGERERALATAREAVRLWLTLAQVHPLAALPDLSASLNNLANQLAGTGRDEEALEAITDTVRIRRLLVQRDPDAYQADLAGGLLNLAIRLDGIGRLDEAFDAATEAVAAYRELHRRHGDAHLTGLAHALHTLAIVLRRTRRHREAFDASSESVRIRRELADQRPDAHLSDLAMSLTTLANLLQVLDRLEEAREANQEAVDTYRELARQRPSAYLEYLASTLTSLSTRLDALGRHAEALASSIEAVDLSRELSTRHSDAFLPLLAAALNNLCADLRAADRREEALDAATEAVDVLRLAAGTRPESVRPQLARSLVNQAGCLGELGRHGEALPPAAEGVELFRDLAEQLPDAYLPEWAGSLAGQFLQLGGAGRPGAALAALDRATELYRGLADARPDDFLPKLAECLNTRAVSLAALDRHEPAAEAAGEAADVYRKLARARPDPYLAHLLSAEAYRAVLLGGLNRQAEALEALAAAVDTGRQLTGAGAAALAPRHATNLMTYAFALSAALGRHREALDVSAEGVDAARELARADPGPFLPLLARSLYHHTLHLEAVDRREEALVVLAEASDLLTGLAREDPGVYEDAVRSCQELRGRILGGGPVS